MNNRIAFNQIKGLFIIVLFVVLTLQSVFTNAQPIKSEPFYRGLYSSFGSCSFNITSKISSIDQHFAMLGGGQIGLILGNKIFRTNLGLVGYYSSVNDLPGTIDLYKTNASVNFYPLSLTGSNAHRVEPYFISGLSYDRFKFHGYYLNEDPADINYSRSQDPYLGTLKQLNASAGAGIVLKITDRFNFVHFFTEVQYGYNLTSKANNARFDNTSMNNNIQLTAGISFGAFR